MGLLASMQNADSLGCPINLYTHSLQTATRALRAREDDELVVVALFHDLPEALCDNHHGLVAAQLLSPWISERRTWLLVQHVDFQQYHFVNHPTVDTHARDRFAGHPLYAETAHFCQFYDQNSFDSSYSTLPLEEFAPIVRRFFARGGSGTAGSACDPQAVQIANSAANNLFTIGKRFSKQQDAMFRAGKSPHRARAGVPAAANARRAARRAGQDRVRRATRPASIATWTARNRTRPPCR